MENTIDNRLMSFDGKNLIIPLGISFFDSELPEINRQNIDFMERFRIEWSYGANGLAMPSQLFNNDLKKVEIKFGG